MLPLGMTFSDQLEKLTLLTINSQEIGDLSAIYIVMKHRKGKEKMIYALKVYCGVIHVRSTRLASRKVVFPAAV